MLMEVMCLRLRRIAKMAGVEENDIDRLLANPPISESMDSPDILEIIKEKRNISKLHISLSNG